MSTSTQTSSLNDKQRRILSYLRDQVDSKTYFKSRIIAEELGMTAKEVGANMKAIQTGDVDVEVEKWGYSSSTTWKVSA